MTLPYRYVRGAAAGRDETCVLCGTRSTGLVVDHCHQHGYARGLLCKSCNARAAVLDSGAAAPSQAEAFHLGNCPEYRRTESTDSPHALALRIAAVALAVASALNLSPRQAATLALSLAEDDGATREAGSAAPGESREVRYSGARGRKRENATTAQPLASRTESLTATVRALREARHSEGGIRRIVRETRGPVNREALKKALQRTRPKA